MSNTFSSFNISNDLLAALAVLGYKEPTPIQSEVIPKALEHRDIVARSQTGSGKTAAFAIPLCEEAIWLDNAPGGLVLEPTRELTVQVKQEIFNIGRNKRIKVPDVFGGFPIDKQIQTLRQKSHIVVGTPGRVMDHIRRESLNLSNIKCLVIDEADLMLDMGFATEVASIIEHIREFNKNLQIMLFSATIDDSLQDMIDKYMKSPENIVIEDERATVESISQIIYECSLEKKYELFKRLLIHYNPDKAIIFCGTREMVDVLCRKLGKDCIKCGMIHGEIEQRDRIRTIEGFKEGRVRYLIATDVAARGIDVDNLTHVFNYDFPTGKETYVHRIGRTGRNGNSGYAISIVCETDKKMLNMVSDYIDMDIPKGDIRDLNEDSGDFYLRQKEKVKLTPKKGADFNKNITRLSIGGGRKSKMRAVDIVGTICSIDGIDAEDIGIIDVRDSLTYVEILNKKGEKVLKELQNKTIKGKLRKVRITTCKGR